MPGTPLSAREIWIRLLLYPSHTLPTAAAPVLVGIGLALHDGIFAPGPLLIAFLASWLIHIGGVFTDNHELLRRHPRVDEHPELLLALGNGTLSFGQLRAAIAICFLLAAATVPYLLGIGGKLALAIGLVGAASSYLYAGSPLPYVKYGFADMVFFLMFGIVAVVGTYYIQWAAVSADASTSLDALVRLPAEIFYVGLPVGGLVVNVMVIDDIRDRHFDAVKGWRTPAVRFGLTGSRTEYIGFTVFAYVAPFALCTLPGMSSWVLLPLLTLPLAISIARRVCRFDTTPDLIRATPRAAYLSMVYAALLGIGLAI